MSEIALQNWQEYDRAIAIVNLLDVQKRYGPLSEKDQIEYNRLYKRCCSWISQEHRKKREAQDKEVTN